MKRFKKMTLALSLLFLLQAVFPLSVRAGESSFVRLWTPCCNELELRERPALFAVSAPAEGKKKKGLSRSRLALSTVLTLGASALAYWSKEQANRAYDTYLKSANPARQQRQYDRAERFDRLAGGALFSMEVGVIFTSYQLFFRR
jgi:hypothetical protein